VRKAPIGQGDRLKIDDAGGDLTAHGNICAHEYGIKSSEDTDASVSTNGFHDDALTLAITRSDSTPCLMTGGDGRPSSTPLRSHPSGFLASSGALIPPGPGPGFFCTAAREGFVRQEHHSNSPESRRPAEPALFVEGVHAQDQTGKAVGQKRGYRAREPTSWPGNAPWHALFSTTQRVSRTAEGQCAR
jgi:hypothetical protein